MKVISGFRAYANREAKSADIAVDAPEYTFTYAAWEPIEGGSAGQLWENNGQN